MAQESLTLTATLHQLASLDRYNHWIFEQIAPALGASVLEVGSGTGNITRFLAADGRRVVATDVVSSYRRELAEQFADAPHVRVSQFDLDEKAPAEFLAELFESVICLNVLEHIYDDQFALRQMHSVLQPGGRLALLVPAHQFLYGEFDRAVGHFRRYERRELKDKLEQADFRVRSLRFFSLAATLPWLINGRFFKRDHLPPGQTNLANSLVPLLKLERLIGPPFGLSLIAIAEK